VRLWNQLSGNGQAGSGLVVREAMFCERDGGALLASGSFQVQLLALSLQLPSLSIGGIECTLGIYLLPF
jgi:hypothetical protein